MFNKYKKIARLHRSIRKRQIKGTSLEFGPLEPRQLMAADLASSTAPLSESSGVVQHTTQAEHTVTAVSPAETSAAAFRAAYARFFAVSEQNVDSSFVNGDGQVRTNFSGTDFAESVAVQRDGKLVVVGGGGADFGVARYLANGELDQSFADGGKTRINFGGVDSARDVLIQPDGKILVVGAANNERDFGLLRLNTDGSLDRSFGWGGRVTTNFSGTDFAEAVALQRDGKIVVVGNGGDNFGVARYLANGQLDQSFGVGGKTRINFSGVDSARDVLIQPDGKILVVGAAKSEADFGLLRLNTDGSLDSSFGQGGKVTTNFSGTDFAESVALQRDGKIVVVGNGGDNFGVARYLPNGQLDQSFGFGGKTLINFSSVDSARDVLIQPDGKILVVGAAKSEADFGLLRLNSNGSLDSSFGENGRVTTNFSGTDFAESVALKNDGTIVVVGGGGADFGVAIYDQNGQLTTEPGTPETPPETSNGGSSKGSIAVGIGPQKPIGLPEDVPNREPVSPPTPVLPSWLKNQGNGQWKLIGTPGDDVVSIREVSTGSSEEIRIEAIFNEETYDLGVLGNVRGLKFSAGAGDDFFENLSSVPVTVYGGQGSDVIHGGSGNDVLRGGAGNDKIYGHAGDDTLRGGKGDDELYGQKGRDRLDGESGSDILRGGAGIDHLIALDGVFDQLFGGKGDDTFDVKRKKVILSR